MDSDNANGGSPLHSSKTTLQTLQSSSDGPRLDSNHLDDVREPILGNAEKKRKISETEWGPKNEELPNEKFQRYTTPEIGRIEAAAKKRDATLQARTNAEFDKAEEESKYSKSAVDSVLIRKVEARDQKRTAKLQARTNAEFDKAEEESKYSKSAVDSVLIRKEEGNKGEKAEVQIKKILKSETEKESSPLLRTLFNLKPTDTVLFPTQSMKKAANKEKADCFMEVEQDQSNEIYKMSIKYVGSGDCSIVNQDHRAKKAYSPDWRNCEEGVLFHCLGGIDSLISRLNYERAIGDRSQDIPFINIDFTEVERKAMEALLVHHTFIGAGTGAFQPHVQSNCILIVGNVQDTNTWRLTPCFTDDDKKKYIQSKWDKYTLAIRGKGMQVEQSYRTDALPQHQLARWVSVWAMPRFINRVEKKGYSYPVDGCEYVGNWWEKPKCTLNIRMKK